MQSLSFRSRTCLALDVLNFETMQEDEPPTAHSPTDSATNPPTNTETNSPTDPPTNPPTNTKTNSPTDPPTNPPTNSNTNVPTDAATDSNANTATNPTAYSKANAPTDPATHSNADAATNPNTNAPTDAATDSNANTSTNPMAYSKANTTTDPATHSNADAATNPNTNAPTDAATDPYANTSTNPTAYSKANAPTDPATHSRADAATNCIADPSTDSTTPTPRPTPTPTPRPTQDVNPENKYVRRMKPGQKCEAPYRNIESASACKAAFDDLVYVAKKAESILPVSYSFEPKGCYSTCFTEHAGYHCRKFNGHPSGNGKGSDGALLVVCKTREGYERVMESNQTCRSQGYTDITSVEECKVAFDATEYEEKRMEAVKSVSFSWEPKGCYSKCFDPWGGYYCRHFNNHATGNGAGSDGDSTFLLCEAN
eukprot:TRINITY_DN918_c1_g1_i8.p1 TRINITY_DN918_c1_g1~~TRINITY_DN918_c1_g1_i8.p1  ORF type:complete len:427 (+),score=40.87 TRINITY_DN918_c1_g1_i8:74-1354(+)